MGPLAMPIRILSSEVVARIAAGEVVERPVSVAKELIENSLDAGASQIEVEVQAGGIGLLRVVDDGSGIPPEEIEAAFQRHATSKIVDTSHLERIETLGFRGEALASIAAVADVTLLTRPAAEVGGAFMRVAGGEVLEHGPRGAPPGTSIAVRNLFRVVPARLKFLKSNAAEAGRITTLVSRCALAYPGVRFGLTIDGRKIFFSQGGGDLRDALAQLYGSDTAAAMLEVRHEESFGDVPVSVTGMVGGPAVTRANRSYVTLFVNRRLIQSRTLTFAVLDAYQGLLMSGRYPLAVLDIGIDPAETDVNVHPAKSEVKFRDEGIVFSAVHHAVKMALGASQIARPAQAGIAAPPVGSAGPVLQSASPRLDEFGGPVAPQANGAGDDGVQAQFGVPVLRVLGQLNSTFIVSEGPQGMYLIDQHTAHERVLFDRLRGEKSNGEVSAQGLLEPETVELTPEQESLLADQMEVLNGWGFSLEPFGERTVLIRALPGSLSSKGSAQALRDVLDHMASEDLKGYDWEDRVLATVACHGAVRAGQDLTEAEMQEMVRLLESTENPHSCPHGRPVMVHMSNFQLEKEFGRR